MAMEPDARMHSAVNTTPPSGVASHWIELAPDPVLEAAIVAMEIGMNPAPPIELRRTPTSPPAGAGTSGAAGERRLHAATAACRRLPMISAPVERD
jgi:hypothetical protein